MKALLRTLFSFAAYVRFYFRSRFQWKNSVFFSTRWATLKEALVERRSKLGESQSLQSVSRDVDDIEGWISEKLQTALDESYKDPSNIQVIVAT